MTDKSSDGPVTRPGVNSLPDTIRHSFADKFVPCVISKVGSSSTPWCRVDVAVLEDYFSFIYPNHELVITKGDVLESTVCTIIPHPSLAHTHSSQDKFKGYVLQEHDRETCSGKCSSVYETFRHPRDRSIRRVCILLSWRNPIPLSYLQAHNRAGARPQERTWWIQSCK